MTTAQRISCTRCQGLMEFRRDVDGPYLDCFQCGHHVDLFNSPAEQARRETKRQENAQRKPEPAPALPPMPIMPPNQGVAYLQAHYPGLSSSEIAAHLGVTSSLIAKILNWKPRLTHYVLNSEQMRELREAIPAHNARGNAKVIRRQALSRMSNISPQVLADVEAGRRVTPVQAQRLAAFYGVPLDALVVETVWSERGQREKPQEQQ